MSSVDPIAAARRQAVKVTLLQLITLLIIAAAAGLAAGRAWAISTLLGGGVGLLATAYMAYATLKHGVGTPAGRVVWSFVLGWVMKILLTLGLLMLAFRAPGLVPLAVLLAYVMSFVTYWYAAWRVAR